MEEELKSLFTPWRIGKCEIRNRIVMTSMGGTDLFGWMEKNHFDRAGAEFILEVARNNAGLVLPGCQPVRNPIMGQWLYRNDRMYRDLAEWMPEFHKTGAKLFIQLTAGFGRSFTVSSAMEKLYTNPVLRALSKPVLDLDKICATASPSPNRWSDVVPSRALTVQEIREYIDAFARTAVKLQAAGVDGIEIHAVHEGYLLDQFTLPYVNHRTDDYGGSFENRYRFPVEIVQAVKRACGDDFPVSLRYSVTSRTKGFRQGALPGEPYEEAGRDMQESEKAAKYLQDAGYDMLNCDNGTYDAWYWAHPPIYMPENCNLADTEHIRHYVDIPVVCAGRLDPYKAAEEISAGRLDAAGFARPFLADPEWVTKLMNGDREDIRPCILCHNGCFNMCHYKGVPNDQDLEDSLHLARCAVNAETMQRDKHYIRPAGKPKTVPIIGGGIGGMEAARVLKLRGHQPVIYEAADCLGGTFIPASAESYKGKLRELLAWYRHEMERLGIEIHLNTRINSLADIPGLIEGDAGTVSGKQTGNEGTVQQSGKTETAQGQDGNAAAADQEELIRKLKTDIIIATGSVPRVLRRIKGHEKMIEACEYLRGEKEPGHRVAVVGGGLTGCEIAYELALHGHAVTIVEMKDDLIAQKGVCLANSSYLREWFAWKQVPVYLETSLAAVGEGEILCRGKDGQEIRIPCDSVISSAGYIPSPLLPESRYVHLVGDCRQIGNLRSVIWRAYEVAMQI